MSERTIFQTRVGSRVLVVRKTAMGTAAYFGAAPAKPYEGHSVKLLDTTGPVATTRAGLLGLAEACREAAAAWPVGGE